MYSELFWEHVCHPRNNRALSASDTLVGEGRFKRCGDRLKLFLKVDDGRIAQACFQAKACAPVVAVASLGTEMLQGLDLEQARQLNIFQMDTKFGGIPPSKRHAYIIFLECLAEALTTHSQKN